MKLLLILLISVFSCAASAQPGFNADLLDTLQYIGQTHSPAKYFAILYYKAIEKTNGYAAGLPVNERQFIFGFESLFAPAFFRSYHDFAEQRPQVFSWQRYYTDTTLNELQYQFMGMNAHINGDMWMALKDKYGYDTLVKYRQTLLRFQKVLNVYFDSLYITSGRYATIRRLHFFTLGIDKNIGRQMILHWRKRQARLALLFYTRPKRCERRWLHIKKRMLHYDRFAKRWIQ